MSTGTQPPDENPAEGETGGSRSRLSVFLPLIAIVAAIALATVLIVGHSNAPALPGNAHSETVSGFAGQTLSPRLPAPSLGGLRNYLGERVDLASYRGKA